jgi:hypothetical protein
MMDIDTRIAFGLKPRRLEPRYFPMKTGMLYDPRRKVLYNFYPVGYYVIRRNVNMEIDDGLYIFSGDQQVEIYDKRGLHIMYSNDVWMTEHPVQMLRD